MPEVFALMYSIIKEEVAEESQNRLTGNAVHKKRSNLILSRYLHRCKIPDFIVCSVSNPCIGVTGFRRRERRWPGDQGNLKPFLDLHLHCLNNLATKILLHSIQLCKRHFMDR